MSDAAESQPARRPGPDIVNVAFDGSSIVAPGGDVLLHYHSGQLGSHPLGEHHLKEARTAFVCPSGYQATLRRLSDNHVVVLRGRRKAGRKTGALNLLSDVRQRVSATSTPLIGLLRLQPTWLFPHVGALHQATQHGYVLDLSDSVDAIDKDQGKDMRPDGEFGAALVRFSETLKRKNSYLVVIVTAEVWRNCDVSAQHVTADWRPPSAMGIAAARLYDGGYDDDRSQWLDTEPFASDLAATTISPADAVRLATAIRHAQATDKLPAETVAWEEFRQWQGYLRRWFRDNKDVYDRVIFIAAAVLGRARGQAIIDAADQLLHAANEENLVQRPLRAPDLVERLANTGAEPDHKYMVSLDERRPGLEEAVMDWVWDQRPNLQEALLKWLVGLATGKNATLDLLERISGVIAGLSARREEGAGRLMRFAATQAQKGGAHRQLAARIIEHVVLHTGIGPTIRDTLLNWADGKDPVRLDLAATVCGGRFGIERTDLALRRLGKILLNGEATPEVIRAAGQALTSLATHVQQRAAVLAAITSLLKDNPKIGARAFLELARVGENSVVPILLADASASPDVRNLLAQAWQQTYRALGTEDCARGMSPWVRAIDDGLPEQTVLDVCMPTLRMTATHSLDAKIVKSAPSRIAERIMEDLVNHKRAAADTNRRATP